MAHIRQSRPDSGFVSRVKVLKILNDVPSSLGSGKDGSGPDPGLSLSLSLSLTHTHTHAHALTHRISLSHTLEGVNTLEGVRTNSRASIAVGLSRKRLVPVLVGRFGRC